MELQGAIFDMDGTLIDSLMFWDVLWAKLGQMYFGDRTFRPDGVTEKAVRTLPLREASYLLHKNAAIGENGEAVFSVVNDALAQFYAETVQLKPGVRQFLDHCRQKGIKMCVASATNPVLLHIVMEKCGISDYFSKIFSCSENGRGKEHPDVFLKAHAHLGTPKESTWIFEDSIVALETAAKAGYHTVGVYDQYTFHADKVAAISTEYIGPGETLLRLIDEGKL